MGQPAPRRSSAIRLLTIARNDLAGTEPELSCECKGFQEWSGVTGEAKNCWESSNFRSRPVLRQNPVEQRAGSEPMGAG
jgi:hypothetical protein